MTASETLKVHSLHGEFAAEVDVRIVDALEHPQTLASIKALWQKTPVLVFRRQSIEENELVRFSALPTKSFEVSQYTTHTVQSSVLQNDIKKDISSHDIHDNNNHNHNHSDVSASTEIPKSNRRNRWGPTVVPNSIVSSGLVAGNV